MNNIDQSMEKRKYLHATKGKIIIFKEMEDLCSSNLRTLANKENISLYHASIKACDACSMIMGNQN